MSVSYEKTMSAHLPYFSKLHYRMTTSEGSFKIPECLNAKGAVSDICATWHVPAHVPLHASCRSDTFVFSTCLTLPRDFFF